MNTRSPGLDRTDEAARSLAVGTRRWIGLHAGYLDSAAGRAELPVTPRVKALIQLALLCHYWEKAAPEDIARDEAVAVVERAWRRPDFPHLTGLAPKRVRQFQLICAALAPAGTVTDARRGTLARLAADGYLAPGRKAHHLRMAIGFYADLAGVGHQMESYQELYASSLLARAAGLPVADLDVCQVTDTVFHLSDYGFRDPGLAEEEREQALRVVERLTHHHVRDGAWEFVAKLVLAQHCLGADPLWTVSGAAGIRMLARAQAPDGAIPGKSVTDRAPTDSTPVEYFRWSYQPTLVTALTTLVVSGGLAAGLATAGTTAVRGAR